MHYRIEIGLKPEFIDHAGEGIRGELELSGAPVAGKVRTVRVYHLRGEFDGAAVERAAERLLADPIVEIFAINESLDSRYGNSPAAVEVVKKPGVMDSVQVSVLKAFSDLGLNASHAWTARRYLFPENTPEKTLRTAAERLLANDSIEDYVLGTPEPPKPLQLRYEFKKTEYDIQGMSDSEMEELSLNAVLSLNLEEMHRVRDYFRDKGRNPTDIELETIAQTWSEHCVHKTLKGLIRFRGPDGKERIIDNLLKQTIARVTRELDKPWCISVFEDNSGIIEFDDEYGVCFKVETHNHPSAIEPYGGAGTGIGGVIRDILGTGLGAKPVANTDVFCFGDTDTIFSELPKGTLHPRRVMKGVVSGVRDYGNRMGIPTVNGAVCFDPRYVGNPLVYCGTVGLIPKDKCFGDASPGDKVIVIGGRTGRDGIHGATFSSVELHEESETVSSGAVQIGNPITEKKSLDVLLKCRDEGLFTAVTDCGAGGLSSSCGEMGEKTGVEVHLERVPLKYDGLSYTEIWISEAQERMTVAVKPENVARVLEICASEDVEATEIGHFTGDGKLNLFYDGNKIAELDMDFMHNGLPRLERYAEWNPPATAAAVMENPPPEKLGNLLLELLAAPNIASKEWIYRQYDHEVQGGSVIKPFVGTRQEGPSDAAVITPISGDNRGVAIACGLNPKLGDLDPKRMAMHAVDEAIRNAVCVGVDPERLALLDNFSWGNPIKPDRLGALVLAAEGAAEAALAFEAPFISGKDSLNNEYQVGSETVCIPHTLLISAMGIVPDVRRCVTSDFKRPGNAVWLVGKTGAELGGSHYLEAVGGQGGEVPPVDLETAPAAAMAVSEAIQNGLVKSAHDCSEGGLGVAAAEMVFGGNAGGEIDLDKVPAASEGYHPAVLLFSETPSRYVIEAPSDDETAAELEKLFSARGVSAARIGTTVSARTLTISAGGKKFLELDAAKMRSAWTKTFGW